MLKYLTLTFVPCVANFHSLIIVKCSILGLKMHCTPSRQIGLVRFFFSTRSYCKFSAEYFVGILLNLITCQACQIVPICSLGNASLDFWFQNERIMNVIIVVFITSLDMT